MLPDDRSPGDPLPAALVRELRNRSGLTQSEFAQVLGLKGRRATVSAWERDDGTPCDGPVAELILRMFAPPRMGPVAESLVTKADAIWRRHGGPLHPYRELAFSPSNVAEMPVSDIGSLYEDTALPREQVQYGFPLNVTHNRRNAVATVDGWVGVLPRQAAESPAKYLWLLDRKWQFLHREYAYEAGDPARWPWQNLGIGFLLRLAAQATFFLKRLYTRAGLEASTVVTGRYHLVGAEGRGFLFEPMSTRFVRVPPADVASTHVLTGRLDTTVGALTSDPVVAALELTADLVARLDLDAAAGSKLREHLVRLHTHDLAQGAGSREMGFLDDIL